MAANINTMPGAPLAPLELTELEQLTQAMDSRALYWLSGYAAGRAGALDGGIAQNLPLASNQSVVAKTVEVAVEQQLTIVYGSQTGNGEALATQYHQQLQNTGYVTHLLSMAELKAKNLKNIHNLLLVVSTHGDGDPPDDAIDFIDQLSSNKAPKLGHLSYAVLALGDSSYPDFCITGNNIDARLAELGAKRWADCAKADLDIEAVAEPWWENLQAVFNDKLQVPEPAITSATVTALHPASNLSAGASTYTRKSPYTAELLTNQRITAAGSDKDVRHIEVDLGDSGITYEPGDALGILPTNSDVLVADLLTSTGLSADASVQIGDETLPLQTALANKREITLLSRDFLEAHVGHVNAASARLELESMLQDDKRRELSSLFQDHQIVDALRRWNGTWDAQKLVDSLRPLTPRMYSIASSQLVTDDEVHTTVARVAYSAHDYQHVGAASSFLADLNDEDVAEVPVFIDRNPRFRLPEDQSRNVIMIGPGTGIAPFRAFVQHRAVMQAPGKNWLFFGAQHFHSQFLYQLEWQKALKTGDLNRLDLAFSRDQKDKIYVQHRMLEQGKDLYAWLQEGAHLYVCGDANYMAKDVDAALHQIVAQHGGHSTEQAHEYVRHLSREKRYLKDVY